MYTFNSNTNAIGLEELHQAYVDTYVWSYNHTTSLFSQKKAYIDELYKALWNYETKWMIMYSDMLVTLTKISLEKFFKLDYKM